LGECPTSHPSIEVASSRKTQYAAFGMGFDAFATTIMQVPKGMDPFARFQPVPLVATGPIVSQHWQRPYGSLEGDASLGSKVSIS